MFLSFLDDMQCTKKNVLSLKRTFVSRVLHTPILGKNQKEIKKGLKNKLFFGIKDDQVLYLYIIFP
jgi:hypothetical protein